MMELEFKDICKTFYETAFAIVAAIVVAAVAAIAVVVTVIGALVFAGLVIVLIFVCAVIALAGGVVLAPCWGVVKIFDQPALMIHAWRCDATPQTFMQIHEKVKTESAINEEQEINDETDDEIEEQ